MSIEDIVNIVWIIVSAIIGFSGGYCYRMAKDMLAKDEGNDS